MPTLPCEAHVPRQQIEDLHQSERADAQKEQLLARHAQRAAPELDAVDTSALLWARRRGEQQEAEGRRERRHVRHVHHGLVRQQEPVRTGDEDQRAEASGTAAEVAGDSPLQHPLPRERAGHDGQTRRPLGQWHSAGGDPGEHRLRRRIDTEPRKADSLQPEVEVGLRPEPPLVAPPERDPVVARQHFARHLRVLRLPTVDHAEGAEGRQIQDERESGDPGSLHSGPGGAEAGDAEPFSAAHCRPEQAEAERRDDDAQRDVRRGHGAGDGPVDDEPERQTQDHDGRERRHQRVGREASIRGLRLWSGRARAEQREQPAAREQDADADEQGLDEAVLERRRLLQHAGEREQGSEQERAHPP
jgi:hypothetical protein